MKKLFVSLTLAAIASVAFAQNAPKPCPKKAECSMTCKACSKAGKAGCACGKTCPKKADCPMAKKG